MKIKSSVAVACFLPGRAKDLSAHLYRLQEGLWYSEECRFVWCFGKIAKGVYCVPHFCLYVCLQGVTWLPLDGCLSNLIISPESLGKNQVSLKSDKNNGTL